MNSDPGGPGSSIPRRLFLGAALLLLALHGVLLAASSWNKSPTYDEPEHLKFGLAFIERGGPEEADAQRMPVTMLNAIGLRLGGGTVESIGTDRRHLLFARVPTMLASLVLGVFLLCWSSARFGRPAGLLALSLYALCPTVIAHGRLATNDLYTALAVFAAVYFFRRLCRAPSAVLLILAGGALGLAQACKFSAVVLVPAFGLVLLLPAARGRLAAWLREHPSRWGLAALFPLSALVALGAAYGFDGLFMAQGEFSYHSYAFAWLEARMPWLRLPLPRIYLEGLDLSRYISTHPEVVRGHNYLFGRLSDDGWWYYFIAVWLLKTPLGTIGIIALRAFRRVRDELTPFLLLPAAAIFAFYSLFSTVQIGVRYLLPLLPLIFLWAGGLLRGGRVFPRPLKLAVAALLTATAISSLAAFPDYISYTGELAGPKVHAWRLVADSNLEWGQDRWHCRAYLEEHPEAILNPVEPTPGHLVVRVNLVTGVFHEERCRWLRENFVPVGTLRGSYLVFRISPDELAAAMTSGAEINRSAWRWPRRCGPPAPGTASS